ncbi:hypothetical protein C5167_008314 [Papaver somniferum]|uniref:Transmembrane protein n=1 Tax=Papaver somniferum TaxID=3469 RepID=A0A4Y7JXX5_PAPSO|nr:hypothetical protein C5167_008314 [Papaver somniferum]
MSKNSVILMLVWLLLVVILGDGGGDVRGNEVKNNISLEVRHMISSSVLMFRTPIYCQKHGAIRAV